MLLVQERFGPVRTRLTLAGFLLTISTSLVLFVLLDTEKIIYSQSLGVAMDTIALVSAALFFDYVHTSVSARGPGVWPYLVAATYLVATGVFGGRFMDPTNFTPIIVTTAGFSVLAFTVYLRSRKTLPLGWKNRPEYKRLPVLLAGIGIFHSAQLLRVVAPGEPLLFDLVPFVGALGLLAFAIYGLIGSQTLRTLASVPRQVAANDCLGPAIDEAMERERIFLDPDLSLQKAAAILGVAPGQLSAHLNSERGMTFRTYVNRLRIQEAKQLLRSPEEARTSIEAIAMMAGFRSRSSFYTAFQSQVHMSPQDYRTEG